MKPISDKLDAVRSRGDARSDLACCLQVFDDIIHGSECLTMMRQYLISTIMEIVTSSSHVDDKEAMKANSMLKRLLLLTNFHSMMKRATDTRFLVFHSHILPVIVESIYQQPTCANRLQYIVGAFSDAIKLCEVVAHMEPAPYVIKLRGFIHESILIHIVKPLSEDIENDLRMHIHTKHLDHLQTVNPKTENLRPLRPFIDLPVVRVLGLRVNIKAEVEHYLNRFGVNKYPKPYYSVHLTFSRIFSSIFTGHFTILPQLRFMIGTLTTQCVTWQKKSLDYTFWIISYQWDLSNRV